MSTNLFDERSGLPSPLEGGPVVRHTPHWVTDLLAVLAFALFVSFLLLFF